MIQKKTGFLLFLFFMCQIIHAQAQDSISILKIKGTVYDKESKRMVSNVMVVNKRTQQGFFSGSEDE